MGRLCWWQDQPSCEMEFGFTSIKGWGLGPEDINIHNSALLAKWGWRYSKEETAFWRKIIRSIHDKEAFDWFTSGKSENSLRSSWVSIVNIIRLFLGDIILEILFDIISLSVFLYGYI